MSRECRRCGTVHEFDFSPICTECLWKCRLCGYEVDDLSEFHQHHTSYKDNETIRVCPSCHTSIHKTDGFRDDLKPELSRKEAEDRGLVHRTLY